jgi:hypothetical protein
MTAGYAFQFTDLTAPLGLRLAEPDDRADIDVINEILTRRNATAGEESDHLQRRGRNRITLHLVPEITS